MLDLFFYSERGIVNSILLDMMMDKENEIVYSDNVQNEFAAEFLKRISFVGGGDRFQNGRIEKVEFLVEPSFAQFGDPDLIAIVQTASRKIAVFIEAKLGTYKECALLKSEAVEDRWSIPTELYRGNTSKINIQLQLKYRFFKTMHQLYTNIKQEPEWKGRERTKIKEELVKRLLGQQVQLNETDTAIDKSRKLLDQNVIQYYVEKLLDCDKAYYVALTNDKNVDNNSEKILNDSECYSILNEQDWEREKRCFGILTYENLEREADISFVSEKGIEKKSVISKKKGYYGFSSEKLEKISINS